MTRSLYAVLNVAPDADPAVIEAAYKALMKKYHPDAMTGATDGDRAKAAEINQAFHVLRDPERRTRYDNDQRALRRPPMPAAGPQVYRAPASRPRRRRWPAVLLILLIAAAAFMWWRDPDLVRDLLGSRAAATPVNAGASKTIQLADIDKALQEYSRIKNRTGLLGLSAFSEDCFADQSRVPTARALDFCIAFDQAAASYGARIAGDDLPQLARFREEEVELRHESAARLVSSNDSWISQRRAKVRQLTWQKLQQSEPELVPPAEVVVQEPAPLPVQAQAPKRARAQQLRRQRHGYQRSSRASRIKRADRDFLEREGYIY